MPDRQTWTKGHRRNLLATADEQVNSVYDGLRDDHDTDATEADLLLAFRDRALAFVLAWTGARGAEVLRDPQDDKRDGVIWADMNDATLRLLGKSREREAAPLRKQVRRRLRNWKEQLDPATDEWPIFPTLDKGALRSALADGLDGDCEPRYNGSADLRTRLDAFDQYGVTPPAMSTNAGRRVMQRLTEAAELDVDGGYLKPHGGRRALGDKLWDEEDPEVAQDALRHKSPETTQQAYREKKQAELAGRMDDILGPEEPTDSESDE